MQLMEAIQLEEGYRRKKKQQQLKNTSKVISHITASSWNTNPVHTVHNLFLQQETAFMYPKLIITRSRRNLTMKLSETLSLKTQAVIYKANTFFVRILSLKAYNVNSMKYWNKKMKIFKVHTNLYSLQLFAWEDRDSKGYKANTFASWV